MPLLYDIGLGLYHTGIHIAALFKPKAKAWVEGRRGAWERYEAKREALRDCLWMHCASVGEFEQGRPVLEAIKTQHPELPVLLTFYSPSGYEARKDEPLATHVDYLPADRSDNTQRLIEMIQPRVVLWVKYEFWHHWLHALKTKSISVFLVSAIFRKEQSFFRWYGGTHRRVLKCFAHVFVQDEASRDLLAAIDVKKVTVSGDTRFDRVMDIVAANEELRPAPAFKGEAPLLIAGSTWPADEALLLKAMTGLSRKPKCMIVPHELDEEHLAAINSSFPPPVVRWSETDTNALAQMNTCIVDRMGLLARLYKYGDIAYVGGGFGDGIHSLLEAAAWGKPVIFGPNHKKFAEARGLIEAGGGFEVHNPNQLRAVLERLLSDQNALRSASTAAQRYVQERVGATQRIVQAIAPMIGR